MALLNNLIDFDPIIDKLWTKFEPKLDAELKKWREQFFALMPLMAAAAGQQILDKVRKIDPDIPIVSDIFDLSEQITGQINDDPRIPIRIPLLGEIDLGNLFGRR